MLKKLITLALVGSLWGSLQTAPEPDINSQFELTTGVEVVNTETGEVIYSESQTQTLEESSGTVTFNYEYVDYSEFGAALRSIRPDATIGGTMNPGSVSSSLTLTYSTRRDEIRLEKVSGSWSPKLGVSLTDRKVNIYNGGMAPESITKYPTANTYAFNTGWGYVIKPPSSYYLSPRALASVRYKITGTNTPWLELRHWVDLQSA
ncbi:hypothetical protein [Canibacter zhoujuaniae]|uniref:hypothetical protein n=1 Tax=Canibacter zhoujuaniae TaxID=2708343 RepID=UPI001421FC01|nr:hypothetical protein [Canibacter zhoujuaniae]